MVGLCVSDEREHLVVQVLNKEARNEEIMGDTELGRYTEIEYHVTM